MGFFNKEVEKITTCEHIVKKAHAGEIEIVYSVITLTEVIKMKDRPRLKEEQEEEIREFFDNEFLIPANVDEWIGTLARNLIWNHNTEPKDSIHVATAIYHNIPIMNTFDEKLLGLDGELTLRNGDRLTICKPKEPPKPIPELFNGHQI